MPRVDIKQVEGFLKVWKNGVVILDDTSKQFAVDFANVVLQSLISQMAEARMMAERAKAEAQKPLVTE